MGLSKRQRQVLADYADQFGAVPFKITSTDEDFARAVREARLVMAGKRGPLRDDEFPLGDCPPGAVI